MPTAGGPTPTTPGRSGSSTVVETRDLQLAIAMRRVTELCDRNPRLRTPCAQMLEALVEQLSKYDKASGGPGGAAEAPESWFVMAAGKERAKI